jgi:dihydroceramide fatty acyl 2-hydroxylase
MLLDLTDDCLAAATGALPDAEDGARRIDIRVFKNAIIERWFARAHWVTPLIWFGPVIVIGFVRGFTQLGWHGLALAQVFGLFLLGVLVWTLSEYFLHRYLFHAEFEGQQGAVRHFLIHGYHHQFPNDPMRLVAPPIMSWPIAAAFAVVYYFSFGPARFATVLAGTVVGYIAYDWIHFYTHHGRPRNAIGKALRRYHMLHHFKSPHAFYGVSSPLWDLVFGTWKAGK